MSIRHFVLLSAVLAGGAMPGAASATNFVSHPGLTAADNIFGTVTVDPGADLIGHRTGPASNGAGRTSSMDIAADGTLYIVGGANSYFVVDPVTGDTHVRQSANVSNVGIGVTDTQLFLGSSRSSNHGGNTELNRVPLSSLPGGIVDLGDPANSRLTEFLLVPNDPQFGSKAGSLLIGGSSNGNLLQVDPDSGATEDSLTAPFSSAGSISGMALKADGTLLVTDHDSTDIMAYDIATETSVLAQSVSGMALLSGFGDTGPGTAFPLSGGGAGFMTIDVNPATGEIAVLADDGALYLFTEDLSKAVALASGIGSINTNFGGYAVEWSNDGDTLYIYDDGTDPQFYDAKLHAISGFLSSGFATATAEPGAVPAPAPLLLLAAGAFAMRRRG